MLFPGFGPDPFTLMRRLGQDFEGFRQAEGVRGFPAVNLWQGADSAAVTAELPGVAAGDIDIQVKDDVLTIAGERKPPKGGEQASWFRRECEYGRFRRMVRLPFRVDADKVEARFQNGVLEIELHRPEQDKPRRVEIRAG